MEGGSSSGSGSSDVGIPALPSLSVIYWRTPCLLGRACQLLNEFGHVKGSSFVVYSLYGPNCGPTSDRKHKTKRVPFGERWEGPACQGEGNML